MSASHLPLARIRNSVPQELLISIVSRQMIHLQIPTRLLARHVTRSRRCYSSSRNPLRVLLCGSDEFSIAGLRALHNLHQSTNDPSVFASIDVVCRPGKRTGRGLKTIREGTGSPSISRDCIDEIQKYLSKGWPKNCCFLYMKSIHSPDGMYVDLQSGARTVLRRCE